MNEVMQNQDCLYTCVTKGSDDTVSSRVIGSMTDYIWAGKDAAHAMKLLKQMADPSTRVVTLTVTEKGYTCNLATGELDMNNPANTWILD